MKNPKVSGPTLASSPLPMPPIGGEPGTPPPIGATAPAGDVPTPPPSEETIVVEAKGPLMGEAFVTGRTSAQATIEEVRPSLDAAGEPRSGEIVPTTAPVDGLGRLIDRNERLRLEPAVVPGSASTRVLRSGAEVPAHVSAAEDGETRLFTAVTRTLRSGKLYEMDAPIPLTRGEFLEKRAAGAVLEADFWDGALLPDL